MNGWSRDLETALHSGDSGYMLAMLSKVPEEVLQGARPYLEHMAQLGERDGRHEEALGCVEQLLRLDPEDADRVAARARLLLALQRPTLALQAAQRLHELLAPQRPRQEPSTDGELSVALDAWRTVLGFSPEDPAVVAEVQRLEADLRTQSLLRRTLAPDRAPPKSADPQPASAPLSGFDPSLFEAPQLPASVDEFRVQGLRQHLRRYSGQFAPRNALQRLQDPHWLAAWEQALVGLRDARVCFRGSELGVLALHALDAGARHVECVEQHPLEARIVQGMAQKHFLASFKDDGGGDPSEASARREAAFERFTERFSVDCAEQVTGSGGDCLVFPQIDHSLLGTGIVSAIREFAEGLGDRELRVLPAAARVFVMAIEWQYPQAPFALESLNLLRWSLYPQPLDPDPALWTALTSAVCAGNIDFNHFAEAEIELSLPVVREGRVDALVYWFELDLEGATLSSAPDSGLNCLRPAVQHSDPITVQAGGALPLKLQVGSHRLWLKTLPAASLSRPAALPSWFGPMLGDAERNRAYAAALQGRFDRDPDAPVLDIGAGCGLLSMLAVRAGAQRVFGCERQPALARIGHAVLADNGMAEHIQLLAKDCRQLEIPQDLPERAGLAVFELFDCGLLGEGILHFLAHARAHLLSADAGCVPAAARLHAQLIEYRFDRLAGIDASLLNPYLASPGYLNVDAARLPYRALTAPFEVFAFDFASAEPTAEARQLDPLATCSGVASAVLFWFDLQLDADHSLSNAPGSTLHWKQALQFVHEARIEAGQTLPLEASHDGSALRFQWRKQELPEDCLSRVPRMDPRWLAASAELEQHTQNLLQHCAQSPEEQAKVVEIALRMAIEPAAYGLDPTIAQRFASLLQPS